MANEEKERVAVGLLYEFEDRKVIRVCTQAQYEKDWWTWGDEYRRRHPGTGRQIGVGMCILEMDGVAMADGMEVVGI